MYLNCINFKITIQRRLSHQSVVNLPKQLNVKVYFLCLGYDKFRNADYALQMYSTIALPSFLLSYIEHSSSIDMVIDEWGE